MHVALILPAVLPLSLSIRNKVKSHQLLYVLHNLQENASVIFYYFSRHLYIVIIGLNTL